MVPSISSNTAVYHLATSLFVNLVYKGVECMNIGKKAEMVNEKQNLQINNFLFADK